MSEDRDPLDNVFGDDTQAATGGEDTQTGSDTQAATGDNTQTAQEAPGKDSVEGGDADDKIDATGTVKMVPLAALEEARKRAKDAEERLSQSGTGADTTSGTGDPEFEPIDPKEDPEGAFNQMMGIVQLNAVNTTLNFSERMARKEHGSELVDKVMEWATKRFETDPAFATTVLTDPDPYETAIVAYNKAQRDEKLDKIDPAILEGLDEDEIELLRQHRAKKDPAANGGDTGSTGADTQPRGEGGQFAPRRNVDPPPKSIASAPSGGKPGGNKEVASGEGVAFDEAFK
jgi:hypothetical protein